MNNCFKCNQPIPTGQEVWMRRKSTDENISFCPRCGQEVQQMLAAQKRAPAASPPTPTPCQEPAPPVATQPSAAIPIGGALILFLVILVVAPLLGGVVALVGFHFMYLIIAFPLFMGWVGGLAMAQGVRWGKVRDGVIAATFGVLLGLSIYASYRYIEYRLVRSEVRAEIVKEMEAEFGMSDAAIADEFFDEVLLEETGKNGFLGVLLLDAQEGMSIAPAKYGSGAEGLNIGTTLTWIYWLLEIVAIAGIAAFMASEAAQKPFCERHDRWYAKEKSLGGVGPGRVEHALALLEQGEYASFARALHQKTPAPGVEFFIERCVGCLDSNPVLTVKGVKRSSRGQVDVRTLLWMGTPENDYCLPQLRGLTRQAGMALLDRAAEVSLLTAHGDGYYTIHPALPWYFKSLFDQHYPQSLITNIAVPQN